MGKYTLTEEQMHELYYYLKLNRMVEDRLTNLYKQGKVVGGLYSSLYETQFRQGGEATIDERR